MENVFLYLPVFDKSGNVYQRSQATIAFPATKPKSWAI